MALDSAKKISIPEFWEITYRTAGPVSRLFALLVDTILIYLILTLLFIVILMTLAFAGGNAEELQKVSLFFQFLMFFAVFWGYFLIFEYFLRGRTPGKMLLGLRVISLRGTGLNASHSIIRNMVRVGDMYPFLFQASFFFVPSYFVAGFFLFLTGASFRRLGDIAAGTMVVREHSNRMATRRMLEAARVETEGIRPLASLTPALMRAIHEYAVRRSTMNSVIRKDLADRFAPQIAVHFQMKRSFENNEQMMLAFYSYLFASSNPLGVDRSVLL
ncbi:MAG: RDD family protein [Leptospiraceae bacterium]|nr:RDD family protein [Leptospiraceae bacterium]